MSFIAPAALWFALVGPFVIALYLLKIRRQRQVVPSLEFWRRLAPETQVRSLFRRLKRWLSLLLWLAAAACLVLALANPALTSGRMKAETIAVVIDNSASMQTVEAQGGGGTRLELAKRAVADLLNRRPANDEWLLIEAGADPRLVQSDTRNRTLLLESVRALEPQTVRGRLSNAVELAAQLLEGKPNPRIVIVSDGASGEVPGLSAADERIVHWPVGETNDNLGIVQFSVRMQRQRGEHHVFVRVVNSSDEEAEAQLVLAIDDATSKVEPLKVPARGNWEKVVVFADSDGGVLKGTIDRADALAADNTAYAVLEPIRPATVILVTADDEAYYFNQVLAAMGPIVDAESSLAVSPDEYEKIGQRRGAADLTIFNNCSPPGAGDVVNAVFINKWPSDSPARSVDRLGVTEMNVANRDHPLMRFLNFRSVKIASAQRVDLVGEAGVLARSGEGSPLIFESREAGKQRLCLAFDILDTELPFRNAFPILLRNAVDYFALEPTAWVARNYQSGDVVSPLQELPADIARVAVAGLGEKLTVDSVPVTDGRFRYGPLRETGALRFEIGKDVAYSAVNLADESESQIRPVIAERTAEEELPLSSEVFGFIPWLGLAVLGTVMISTEWFTYHRRWTE